MKVMRWGCRHIGKGDEIVISCYEHELLVYATKGLLTIPGLRLIGTAKEKAGVHSFVLNGFRTEGVGAALNREGIAVRNLRCEGLVWRRQCVRRWRFTTISKISMH